MLWSFPRGQDTNVRYLRIGVMIVLCERSHHWRFCSQPDPHLASLFVWTCAFPLSMRSRLRICHRMLKGEVASHRHHHMAAGPSIGHVTARTACFSARSSGG